MPSRARVLIVASLCTGLFASGLAQAEWEWINKDFKNTRNARNDLHWFLSGHIEDAIVATYDPPELPLVDIEETGPAPTTLVKWSGGIVQPGITVHAGILVDWDEIPGKRFRHGAYWSQDGFPREKVAGCASVNLEFGDIIYVSVANSEDPYDPPLDVADFAYAFVDTPMGLPDLTWNNPDIDWVPVPGSETIPSTGELPIATIPMTIPGRFLIWEMSVNFSGDPTDYAGHIIVQREVIPEPACPGDIDGDGDTDHADLGALLSAWCSQEGDPNWNAAADLDGDGHVGHGDLGILLADWGCGT